MKYLFKIAPGWILIAALVYIYVAQQTYLISDWFVLSMVVVVGISFSFLFSSLEMAIASLNQDDLQKLDDEAATILRRKDELPPDQYTKEHLKILRITNIYYNSEKLNAPIVICNNIANVVVAAYVPAALNATLPATSLTFQFGWLQTLVGCEVCAISLPGEGTESLTFFSVLLLIIIFGEIIPKKLAINNSLWFVRNLSSTISIVSFMFGWIGTSLISVVEIPANAGEKTRNLRNRIWKKSPGRP